MKLSEVKTTLLALTDVNFELPDGTLVPSHFHVTEIGSVNKRYIDCGGVMRNEKLISFQLWEAEDFDHRITPGKLLDIIALSEKSLGLEDMEVEVEYQSETIGRYELIFNGKHFVLMPKQTNCLAPEKCGIPKEKIKVRLSTLTSTNQKTCKPDSGCC